MALFPYLIDAHGDDALHIISLMDFAKNVLIYASAFFANGIVLSAGVKLSLLIYGVCQAICWLTTIPMYVYGKRARSFVSALCSSLNLFGPHAILNALMLPRSHAILAFSEETSRLAPTVPDPQPRRRRVRRVERSQGSWGCAGQSNCFC